MEPSINQFPKQPFNRIALAASGGGFRAATYMLGTLAYLQHIKLGETPLLDHVCYIASTSGGSLTNAFYNESLLKSEPFEQFYQQMLTFLDGDTLLKEVYQVLQEDSCWKNTDKRRNLINAFALVYDRRLNGLTLGQLSQASAHSPLKEVCFNATEFTRGLPFRFQTQEGMIANLIGNRFLSIKADAASRAIAYQLKVGDIIAASSCFPAGFEPMLFPDDFTYATLPKDKLQQVVNQGDTFGLMDGGITDNQAVGSVQRAQERRKNAMVQGGPDNRFDLLLVTDVSNLYSPTYVPPEQGEPNWFGRLRIRQAIWLLRASPYITCLCALLFFVPNYWLHSLGAMFVLPTALLWWLRNILTVRIRRLEANVVKNRSLSWKAVIEPYAGYFMNLQLSVLKTMLLDRLNTVIVLASDLFLKRIRRGDYERLFEDSVWRHRRAANFIYDLSSENKINRLEQLNRNDWQGILQETLIPSTTLETIAEKARLMGTTLWFDTAHQDALADIVATGQFTTCYNLIEYLCRLEQHPAYKSLKAPTQQQLATLKDNLVTDWKQFNQQPYWLHHSLNTPVTDGVSSQQ